MTKKKTTKAIYVTEMKKVNQKEFLLSVYNNNEARNDVLIP